MFRILLVNPSFASKTEQTFWNVLAKAAADGLAEVHAFTMRSVEHPPEFHAECHPARLMDYGLTGHGSLIERHRIMRAPEWFKPADATLQVDWERRRWGGALDSLSILRGLHRLAVAADRMIADIQPDLVLTTNKIDHPCSIFRQAALAHTTPAALIERSPFAGIWLERQGLFAESDIAQAWPDRSTNGRHREIGATLTQYLRDVPATFRVAEDSLDTTASDVPQEADPRPGVLLLMDNVLWTGWAQPSHPQRPIDYPYLGASPQSAIDHIGAMCAERGMRLRLRAHPSCKEKLRWQLPNAIMLSDSSLGTDLSAADTVIAFNTKVAFAAAAHGKPVATLAPNPIEASGCSTRVRSDAELASFLDSPQMPAPAIDGTLEEFSGWLATEYMIGEESDDVEVEPARLIQRLRSLASTPPPTAVPQPVDSRVPVPRQHESVPDDGPLTLFEASRLQSAQLKHSGIAFAQRCLAERLAAADGHRTFCLIESDPKVRVAQVDVAGIAELANTTRGHVVAMRPAERKGLLGTLRAGDIYHSTHRELPPGDETGEALRALTIHDVIHEFRSDLDQLPGVPYITHILDRTTDVDLFLCDSAQTRRDLIRARPIPSTATAVVPLGISPQSDLPAGRAIVAPYVLTVAQASKRKNMPGVGEALNLLVQDERVSTDLELLITGSTSGVDALVAHLSAESRRKARLVHDPSQQRLGHLFRDAEVCLFGSAFEGFGLIPLEAMAHGCPVVTPANSSLVEVCADAAEYSLSTSPDDLYGALARVLLQPQLAQQLRQAGLRRAQLLSWDESAKAHLNEYAHLRTAGPVRASAPAAT